ncbi:MAG TPA: hypothetical protein VII22_14155 [Streptosporangiaceae bacterium]
MADAAGRPQPGPWYLRGGRAAGAGLTGAAVGAGVAAIWHAGWEAAGNACQGAGDAFCIPVVPAAAAVLGSCILICVGVITGFLLLQVRLKRLTIPVGCVLAAMLIWAIGAGIPGGVPPPAWTAALAAGAGLTSLALMVDSGRVQIAGFVAIVVVIAGVSAVPHLIYSRVQQDARERQLAALGLPLMLPTAAGYHASGADAANGGLSVSMSSDAPSGSALSRLPAFVVNITPASSTPTEPGSGGKPVECGYLPPRPECRELKPRLWLLPDGGAGNGGEVITWRGGLKVDVMTLGYSPVNTTALVQAATDLRPATAATLAGLGP